MQCEQHEVVLDRLRASSPLAWSAGTASWERGEALDDCLGRADQSLYRGTGAVKELRGTRRQLRMLILLRMGLTSETHEKTDK